jgi:hypothetical protein
VTACNLEVVERAKAIKGALRVEGWMFDSKGRRVSTTTTLVLRDRDGASWTLEIPNAIARPDVAAHFNVPAAAGAGFSIEAPLPAGAGAPFEVSSLQRYGADVLRCAGTHGVD